MLKPNLQLFICLTLITGVSSCKSTQPDNKVSALGQSLPSWVSNPPTNNGLAASSCVPSSNSFSMDKSEASTQARVELAAQLRTRVASLQEEYSEKITSTGQTNSATQFNVTTTTLVDQMLQGSKVQKVDYAMLGDIKNMCALVTISEADTKRLFSQLLRSAPIELSPENETLLYLNFLKSENTMK